MPVGPETARRVLEALLSRGGDYADLFVESHAGATLSYEGQVLDEAATGRDLGAGLRLVDGAVTYFANGNDVSEAALLGVARDLASALPEGRPTVAPAALEPREAAAVSPVRIPPSARGPEQKVELLVRADRAARERDPRVSQVRARYRDSERTTLVATSDGRLVSDRVARTTLFVSVVARDAGMIRSASKAVSGTCGLELFEEHPPEEPAREAARVACLQLEAEPAPAGTFTVVLSSRAGGTMIHEACGHGLEADFILKGLSVYAGRLGYRVAAECITVVDDATLSGRRGSFGVDDEGFPSRRNVLVEKGVLKGFMHSRKTATEASQAPTGNGRRESYRHLPLPRMTNTFIAPGEDDPDAIVASVEDGIFVADMGGGEVDIVSGNFVFHCTEAYRIRSGRIAEPLRDAILTGTGPEVLSRIDRVGRDLGFQVGTCGKDGQQVPVADAQPTLRIPRIVVGGRAG